MKKYVFIFLIAIISFSYTSCTPPEKGISKTVLVYMAGNNNLSGYCQTNINDMKEGYVPDYFEPGKSGDVLLVYYHLVNQNPKLVRISKDKHGAVTEEIIIEYENQNSASATTVREVLEYANDLFPAKENGLILWSHGTGWLPKGYYSNPSYSYVSPNGVSMTGYYPGIEDPDRHLVKSFAEDSGKEIEIIELAAAMPIRYSYIVFDACLMGGIEIAYEFKDKADYVISSAAEIMALGFPYKSIMKPLFDHKVADLTDLCANYFNFYNSQSSSVLQSATISLVKTSKLETLAQKAKVVFDGGRHNITSLDMTQIQGYFRVNKHWYYDLDDLMKGISEDPNAYSQFVTALNEAIIYKNNTPFFMKGSSTGFEIKRYSGLSTYIPNPENSVLDTYYKTFAWNKAVGMVQ